jgi:hypothetical protein
VFDHRQERPWGWLAAAAIDLYRRTPLLTPVADR